MMSAEPVPLPDVYGHDRLNRKGRCREPGAQKKEVHDDI